MLRLRLRLACASLFLAPFSDGGERSREMTSVDMDLLTLIFFCLV